jgi:hypothetical protein
MIRQSLLLLLLTFISNELIAQKQWSDEVWLIDGKRQLSTPFKKWKPEFQIDGRNTLLPEINVQVAGVRFGAEHKRIHRFGIGIYSWSNDLSTSGLNYPEENVAASNYNFSYASLYYERVLYFDRKWEVAATAHLGNGTIERSIRLEGEEDFSPLEEIQIRPLELSASGFYHITWWLSAGGGFGYRIMRDAPEEIENSFNAPIYMVKIKLRIGKLVKSIFKPEVKDEY